ncbi:MAG: hypothetical protein MUO34_10665 [Ignavibacteriaceae bacterium]|nr:hypothetical protein [Ignavibacteriaceae bacterium]
MKTSLYKTVFLLSVFLISISSSPIELYAQQIFSSNDDIGGSSSGTLSVQESDNSLLYIVGGLVIVGVVVYAVLKNKKEKEKSETDSITIDKKINKFGLVLKNNQLDREKKPPLPVDIYFGMQHQSNYLKERKYVIGLRLNI